MVAPLVKEVKIVKVGPIIGSHVGQGMLHLHSKVKETYLNFNKIYTEKKSVLK